MGEGDRSGRKTWRATKEAERLEGEQARNQKKLRKKQEPQTATAAKPRRGRNRSGEATAEKEAEERTEGKQGRPKK